ncbi:MAG TPA: AgmX/PglI C-terminal domain-containing protein [Kofleriaceae bacterium]|nr:AgmX/PglI C-terminal domain-containing protein [Kofleriaceae bacterium]
MTEQHTFQVASRRAASLTLRLGLALGLAGGLAVVLGAGLTACGGSGLGADTRADITARMTSAQPPLQACYASALKGNRKLRGMIVLSFVAAPQTGQFQEILVTRDELNDPAVRQCVLEEVGKLKLEKPQASRVSISYPIRFEPSN